MSYETDTPRTDEEMWTTDYHHELCNVVNTEFAQQLERELSHSLANQLKTQAEVERLDKERRELSRELHMWEMGMYFKPKMQAKIDELKAEVERLRSQLELAVEIAEEFWNTIRPTN